MARLSLVRGSVFEIVKSHQTPAGALCAQQSGRRYQRPFSVNGAGHSAGGNAQRTGAGPPGPGPLFVVDLW
jgi:hypothetical protein